MFYFTTWKGDSTVNHSAVISFRLTPDHHAILKALAGAQGKFLGELVRETVEEALDLEERASQLQEYSAGRGGPGWSSLNG